MLVATSAQTVEGSITYQEDVVASPIARRILAVSRIVVGAFFLWPFLDKLFGLGYATPLGKGWLAGTAPAQGFIGRVDNFMQPIVGIFNNPFGDAFFMLALLAIGVAFIAGAGLRLAAWGGTVLVALMWLSELPFAATALVNGELVRGATNPFLDDHWLEALIMLTCAYCLAGDTWGVGKLWARITHGNEWLR